MKLSEAIRLGAMLKPQTHGSFSGKRLKRLWGWLPLPITEEATCALGAAYEAYGGGFHEETATEERKTFRGVVKPGEKMVVMHNPDEWTRVFHTCVNCPQCHTPLISKHAIPHLNDEHRWTREQIADWVETIERRVEAEGQPQPETEAAAVRLMQQTA